MRRRIQEVEVDQVVDPEGLEEEDDVAKVDPLDLGDGVVLQFVLIGPGCVQSERRKVSKFNLVLILVLPSNTIQPTVLK